MSGGPGSPDGHDGSPSHYEARARNGSPDSGDPGRVDVVVIGSGISGLAVAHRMHRAGAVTVVLERDGRAGGAMRSRREEGVLVEGGPNSTLDTTPLLGELISEAGVEHRRRYAADAAKKRFILRDSRLHALAQSPPAFLASRLFSWSAKLRLAREPFIPPAPPAAEETVADFVQRRLGTEFLDYAINPFVAGVYAGDPALLDVRAAFPRLHEIEQTYGSLIKGLIRGAKERKRRGEASKTTARMFSFDEGMQVLTDALAAGLPRLHLGTRVTSLRRDPSGGYVLEAASPEGPVRLHARAVVIAAHAEGAAGLSAELAPELRSVFDAIIYPPVAVVTTAYRREDVAHPLDGFGFLIPAKERRGILGTIFTSTIFPDRAPEGTVVLTSFVGGMRSPDLALQSDDRIAALAHAEQLALLGTPAVPRFSSVTAWTRAIPQYTRGHLERMAAIERVEAAQPGLYFCANYRGGISVGDCVKSADRTVQALRAFLQTPPHGDPH